MMARDERRFRVADQDGDSVATREELTAFLHPEEFPHMRDIVVAVSESQPPPRCLLWGFQSPGPPPPSPRNPATSTDPWRATSFIHAPMPLPVSLQVEGLISTPPMPNFSDYFKNVIICISQIGNILMWLNTQRCKKGEQSSSLLCPPFCTPRK